MNKITYVKYILVSCRLQIQSKISNLCTTKNNKLKSITYKPVYNLQVNTGNDFATMMSNENRTDINNNIIIINGGILPNINSIEAQDINNINDMLNIINMPIKFKIYDHKLYIRLSS